MESSIKKRLRSLKNLQEVDSGLDKIEKLRGVLPEEVRDLEDEVAGFFTRQQKIEEEVTALEKEITTHKNSSKDAEDKIKHYEEQQLNVRNSREYDALTKEIEYQQLEIQHLEKKSKKNYLQIEELQAAKVETAEKLKVQEKLLDAKKKELEVLVSESTVQEKALYEEREKAVVAVEERLLKSYEKIRANARNGLAVVSVRRGACGGCFNVVPLQQQAEVREQRKILVCEHCGRIIYDVLREDPPEQKKKRSSPRKAKTKSTTTSTKPAPK